MCRTVKHRQSVVCRTIKPKHYNTICRPVGAFPFSKRNSTQHREVESRYPHSEASATHKSCQTPKGLTLNNRRSFRPAVPMLYQWHSEGVLHLPAHLTLFGRPFQGRAVSSGAVSRGCSAPTVIERQPLRGLARLMGSGRLGVGILRFNLSRSLAVFLTLKGKPRRGDGQYCNALA